MEPQNPPLIVIIPTPGMGHLIPLVELAKKILNLTPLNITFIIPTLNPSTRAQESVLSILPPKRSSYYFLPHVDLNEVSEDAMIETRISLTFSRSLSALRAHLKDLKEVQNYHLSALIVDLFGTDGFDLALEFKMSPYLFFPTTAMCLSLILNLPLLDSQVSCEYRDMVDPIDLPGCIPVHGKDFFDPVQDRTNEAYKWILHHAKRYMLAEGILVNSFSELEEGALKNLMKGIMGNKPLVYPVGPLAKTGFSSVDENVDGSDCLKWLDDQPRGSVLFVSFGSGGTLTHEQILELAYGLEMSEQRFLWVLRSPQGAILNATFFSTEGDKNNPLDFLPSGFLDRTKQRGLVIPMWAPQVKVLNHEATGGFLTHCGWNSILEAVVHGVPLIAWPLYAEQKMNALMLTEGMKLALRPNPNENGLIGRGEMATVVKGLMEGEEGKGIRNRMKELKDASTRALGEDGSSTKALLEVAQKWRFH